MKPSRDDQEGFTLLEVLGAILIFALGIMALYRVQIGSINSNAFSNDLSQATKLAEDKIDYLMSLGLENALLADTNGDGTGQDANGNGIDDDNEGTSTDGITDFGLGMQTADTADNKETQGRFTILWNVALDQPMPGSRTIRVIVRWTGKHNTDHSITMDTVKGFHY